MIDAPLPPWATSDEWPTPWHLVSWQHTRTRPGKMIAKAKCNGKFIMSPYLTTAGIPKDCERHSVCPECLAVFTKEQEQMGKVYAPEEKIGRTPKPEPWKRKARTYRLDEIHQAAEEAMAHLDDHELASTGVTRESSIAYYDAIASLCAHRVRALQEEKTP